MELYLIRHADAEPLAPPIDTDEERPLTPAGLEQCRALADALLRAGVQFDRLYTSPLLRARQTADELLRRWTGPTPELIVADALGTASKPKTKKRFLLTLDGQVTGLIGHQPDLSETVGWLIGGKKAEIRMAKAGVARVDCVEGPGKGAGVLKWLVGPEWYGK